MRSLTQIARDEHAVDELHPEGDAQKPTATVEEIEAELAVDELVAVMSDGPPIYVPPPGRPRSGPSEPDGNDPGGWG